MSADTLEKWFKDKLGEHSETVEFRTEEAILDFTEKVCEVMEAKNISRAELAERMGVSRAFVTKILNGTTNFTLKTMVSISTALDLGFGIQMPPKGFKVPDMSVWTNVEIKEKIDYMLKGRKGYQVDSFVAEAANEYDYEKNTGIC